MRSFPTLAALALCSVLACSCDGPGTAPPTTSNGSELILEHPASGAASTTDPTDTSGNPVPITGPLLDTTDLLGPVAFPVGGSVRRLSAFLETDRTVHIWATSDGTKSGSYDRQTNWHVDITADAPLDPDWVRNGEAPYRSVLRGSDSGRSWQADMPTLAIAHEFRIRGPKGTLVHFKVSAGSGFRPPNNADAWSPDPVPNSELVPMLTMGLKQKPIGSTSFRIRLP